MLARNWGFLVVDSLSFNQKVGFVNHSNFQNLELGPVGEADLFYANVTPTTISISDGSRLGFGPCMK